MTQPSQANPHRIFLAPFQPPVRNPQETPGKPKETLTVAAETRRQPPSNCPRTPFAPLQGFLSPCIARFVFFCAQTQTPRRLHSIGRGNTFRASQLDACAEDVMPPGTQGPLAWHQPSPLLTSRHLWDSNPHGKTPSAQQADALAARPKCLLQNLQVRWVPVQALM